MFSFSLLRRLSLVVAVALALSVTANAGWAVALKTHTTLEVVSNGDSHTVELDVCPRSSTSGPCPNVSADEVPYLAGETMLMIQLSMKRDPMLTARFVPEGHGSRELLCGHHRQIFLNGAAVRKDCSFKPFAVEGTSLIPLRLGFRLPAGVPITSIAGGLVLGLDGKDEGGPIPITGAAREYKGVVVNPTALVLDSDDPEGEVTLIGPDVVELLRSFALGSPSATLRDDAGDTTTATVEFPSAAKVASSSNPNLAKGKVTLEPGDPPAGKYTGKLPLSHASSGSPGVEIELNSHECLWLMVGFVFLGIVSVGLATRLVTLATRRSLLLAVLNQSMEVYGRAAVGEIRSWDLKDLLTGVRSTAEAPKQEGPGSQSQASQAVKRWMDDYKSPHSGTHLQGLAALEESIREARSSKDLDEDADRTLNMIARIQRWLRVEPVARLLWDISKEKPSAALEVSREVGTKKKPKTEHKVLRWRDSQTYLGTLALLEMVKREPADPSKADDLVARLLDQARLHHELVLAWKRATKDSDLAEHLIKLDEEIKAEKITAGARTPEQADAVEARLLSIAGPIDQEEDSLSHLGRCKGLPPEVDADEAEELGITPVDWDASPSLFTGWATLDGPSYGQLVRRAATSSRTVYRRGGFLESCVTEAKTLRPVDVFWTLGILGFSSLAYGVTNYSHTWGSGEDMAKAFLAGATGAAAVKWAALPIFRSARIRSSKAA